MNQEGIRRGSDHEERITAHITAEPATGPGSRWRSVREGWPIAPVRLPHPSHARFSSEPGQSKAGSCLQGRQLTATSRHRGQMRHPRRSFGSAGVPLRRSVLRLEHAVRRVAGLFVIEGRSAATSHARTRLFVSGWDKPGAASGVAPMAGWCAPSRRQRHRSAGLGSSINRSGIFRGNCVPHLQNSTMCARSPVCITEVGLPVIGRCLAR